MSKAVLVTGSSKGLGRGIIEKFASEGYNVVINYVNSKDSSLKLKEFVEKKYNIKALVLRCDITNEFEVNHMIEEAIDNFGNIDVLINNVGIEMYDDIFDKNKEDFMRTFEVNNYGTFLVSKELIKNSKVSTIINISSTDSMDTYNEFNIDYSMSKAGINILTKVFALKFRSIKVCALAPNFINTEGVKEMNQEYLNNELIRVGQKKLLTVEEVSNKVYEMVDDKNIKSGEIVRMEGGSNA